MTKCEEIDRELCRKKYNALEKNIHANIKNIDWNQIKANKEVLEEAIETHKEGSRDVVNGISICESILLNYDDVDNNVYHQLVDWILINSDFARTREYVCPEGYEAPSFLILVLRNPELKLFEEQKNFVICETHGQTNSLSDEHGTFLVHGMGPYDIRYWVLRNSNWSLEEKERLVHSFWPDLDDFREVCKQWESDFINNPDNKDKKGDIPNLTRISEKLVDLRDLYDDKDTINRISQECNFLSMVYDILDKRESKVQKKAIGIFKKK